MLFLIFSEVSPSASTTDQQMSTSAVTVINNNEELDRIKESFEEFHISIQEDMLQVRQRDFECNVV